MTTPKWLLEKVAELNKRYQESTDYQETNEVEVPIFSKDENEYSIRKLHLIECVRCFEPFVSKIDENDDTNTFFEMCTDCNKTVFQD